MYGWPTGYDPMSESQAIGVAGELHVCDRLVALPGFIRQESWISHDGRRLMGLLPAKINAPDPSADFAYVDTDGALTGKPGTKCYVEVKSSRCRRARCKPPILSSSQEALKQYAVDNDQVFIALRVVGAAAGCTPRIAKQVNYVPLFFEGDILDLTEE